MGAVNCDEDKALASRFEVRGFPTIKIFGAEKRKPISYNGARTAEVINILYKNQCSFSNKFKFNHF